MVQIVCNSIARMKLLASLVFAVFLNSTAFCKQAFSSKPYNEIYSQYSNEKDSSRESSEVEYVNLTIEVETHDNLNGFYRYESRVKDVIIDFFRNELGVKSLDRRSVSVDMLILGTRPTKAYLVDGSKYIDFVVSYDKVLLDSIAAEVRLINSIDRGSFFTYFDMGKSVSALVSLRNDLEEAGISYQLAGFVVNDGLCSVYLVFSDTDRVKLAMDLEKIQWKLVWNNDTFRVVKYAYEF